MKKILVSASIVCLCLISCNNKKQDENTAPATTIDVTKNSISDTISQLKTFVVITSYATTDKKKINDHMQKQTAQLDSLWNEGIVENTYYNANTKFGANDKLGSIVFFIKAANVTDAKNILNTTDFMVNNIGKYDILPVGNLWLQISDKAGDVRLAKGKVFAAVWDLTTPYDKIDPKVIKDQFDADLKLYNDGIVENAYLGGNATDIQKNPAVYFVNATDEKEAKSILDKLPLIKTKSGKYELYDVGTSMKGVSKK